MGGLGVIVPASRSRPVSYKPSTTPLASHHFGGSEGFQDEAEHHYLLVTTEYHRPGSLHNRVIPNFSRRIQAVWSAYGFGITVYLMD
jgi:hypothetical protein